MNIFSGWVDLGNLGWLLVHGEHSAPNMRCKKHGALIERIDRPRGVHLAPMGGGGDVRMVTHFRCPECMPHGIDEMSVLPIHEIALVHAELSADKGLLSVSTKPYY